MLLLPVWLQNHVWWRNNGWSRSYPRKFPKGAAAASAKTRANDSSPAPVAAAAAPAEKTFSGCAENNGR